MAIVHMARSFEQAEKAGGSNIRLYQDIYRHTTINRFSDGKIYENRNPNIPLEEQPEEGFEFTPLLWLYDTHVGFCLSEREQNMHNDSDFFMTVWNPVENKPESIEFASTRGWCYPCLASHPDATPEVQAAYAAWKKERDTRLAKEYAEAEAKRPSIGKTVRVVRGRKLPKGTVGQVFWMGQFSGKYACTPAPRLGIRLENNDRVFTSAANVEVVR